MTRIQRTIGVGFVVLTTVSAADIEGMVLLRHTLTKKRVTVSAGAYDRGVSVRLGSDPDGDPLVFERTHVVVYLEGDLPCQNTTTASMEQKNRRFVPDLLVVPVGTSVSFPNIDPIFHNVFSLSKPKSFDLGNYSNGQTRTVILSRPGVVLVNCRLHANMAAAIMVTPNCWSARAGADGRFLLRNVPPGKHTVVAWHKSAGFFRKTVVLSEGHGGSVSFDIPLDENGQLPAAPNVARR